jgi:hypothetical protein
MVGPVLLCFNIHFPLIPDLLLLSLVAMFAVFDVCQMCVMSICQIRHSLDVPCFTVPSNQSVTSQPAESSPQNNCSHNE